VNRQEEVCLLLVGDVGAFFERDKRIVCAREDDFRTGEALLDELSEPPRYVQAKILLR
jgi:hypothetical protein